MFSPQSEQPRAVLNTAAPGVRTWTRTPYWRENVAPDPHLNLVQVCWFPLPGRKNQRKTGKRFKLSWPPLFSKCLSNFHLGYLEREHLCCRSSVDPSGPFALQRENKGSTWLLRDEKCGNQVSRTEFQRCCAGSPQTQSDSNGPAVS